MLTFAQTGTEFSAGAATRWGPRFQPTGMPEEFTLMLAEAADNRLDDAERAARYRDVNRYLVEQAIAAPIVWIDDQWIVNKRVQGSVRTVITRAQRARSRGFPADLP